MIAVRSDAPAVNARKFHSMSMAAQKLDHRSPLRMAAVAHGAYGMPTYAATNIMAQPMNQTGDGQQWLVLINQDTRREMSTSEVQTEVQAGVLSRETLVWRAGMSAWQSISSIAELGLANARPTVPRAKATVGWDAPLVPTPRPQAGHDHAGHQHAGHHHAGHHHSYQLSRSGAQNPQLILELVATGAAVLLIVLVTSYTLYAGGAFRAGGESHGEGTHAASAEARTAAH